MSDIAVYFAAAVLISFLALYIKQIRADFSLLISLAGGAFLLFAAVPRIVILIEDIRSFSSLETISGEYVTVILKVIGITYLCEFSADICVESGEIALAKHVETLGKTAVAFIALPVVENVFSLILDLLR